MPVMTDTDRVRWIGSETCAPGPGARYGGTWLLLGTIERISPVDPNSIRVRWDNGRVTVERRRNLRVSWMPEV